MLAVCRFRRQVLFGELSARSWSRGRSCGRSGIVRGAGLAGSCRISGRVRSIVCPGGKRAYTLAGCALRNLRIVVLARLELVERAWFGLPGSPFRGTCKGVYPLSARPHDQLKPTSHDMRAGEADCPDLTRTTATRPERDRLGALDHAGGGQWPIERHISGGSACGPQG